MRYVIIPHLEPCVSPWILSEYRFTVDVLKSIVKVVFTNVRNDADITKLKEITKDVYNIDFNEFIKMKNLKYVVVLDPQATNSLSRSDLELADAVIIGGIMGDHPPRGRTKRLITDRVKAQEVMPRNLGSKQLTIAGTAYILRAVWEGKELSSIELIDSLNININLRGVELTIELPYAFPVVNGKPVVPRDYIDIIKGGTVYFEGMGKCLEKD